MKEEQITRYYYKDKEQGNIFLKRNMKVHRITANTKVYNTFRSREQLKEGTNERRTIGRILYIKKVMKQEDSLSLLYN